MSRTIDRQATAEQRTLAGTHRVMQRVLLACGIAAPALYVVMNIVGAIRFKGYSTVNQTVSELSAIGAPSRSLWLRFGILYGALLVAFGVGVWMVARGGRSLRIVGALLIADGLLGLAWPPMHLRGAGTSLTDAIHIVFTAVTVPIVLVAIGVGASALGKRFRIYSIFTIVLTLVFGALTGFYGPRIPKNLPTPWIGVWERVSIAGFMLWFAVLAVALVPARREGPRPPRSLRRLA